MSRSRLCEEIDAATLASCSGRAVGDESPARTVLVDAVDRDGTLHRRPLLARLVRLVVVRYLLPKLDARLFGRKLEADVHVAGLGNEVVAALLDGGELGWGGCARELDVVELREALQRPREGVEVVLALEYGREELSRVSTKVRTAWLAEAIRGRTCWPVCWSWLLKDE